ncbi:helix-turn-helix domain-containing protein [Rathayibacter sp. VKM Ac-2803]|uniref:helix-turn-helix transcriptional regulator n=1 Tax=unclassified Rathayibacter TaxID=2609250 RepID=UPI00135A2C98|nr:MULTISPECIES: helix-turn-helix domain-containing protein [unclassified Rathayibacter]MWV48147.1 helix-turn-helix domain-containing protein [Rathayibacter sp. VKM Ac-2803]MWV59360.1 helix-turn-helix domain-containing protein [Rathayibacter sp. VKM Ac-2754]
MPASPVTSTSLRGSAGSKWFLERGVSVSDSEGLQLYANEMLDASTRLTRVWHSSITADVHVENIKSSLIFLQIEGVSMVELEEWEGPRELRPGGFAVFPLDTKFTMRSESEIARYETEFDLEDLPPSLRELVAPGFIENEPLPGYRQLVVSAASSALGFGLAPAEAGFSHFLRGFTSFLTALLVQTLEDRRAERPDRVAQLYDSALGVIEREFKAPDFTVADLASAVGVSPRYLRRVFAQKGTSPKSVLREVRLKVADEYLSAAENGARIPREVIAHVSGFGDARALRRALEQHGRRLDDVASDDEENPMRR